MAFSLFRSFQRQRRDLRVPLGDLRERQARVHPVELGLPAGHVLHDRLDVERRLPGLAELLVRHQAFLLVEDRDEPVVGLGDDRADVRRSLLSRSYGSRLRSSAKSSSPVSIWATRVATSGTGIQRISSTQAVLPPP